MLRYQYVCAALVSLAVVCANPSNRKNGIRTWLTRLWLWFLLLLLNLSWLILVLLGILEVYSKKLLVEMVVLDLPIDYSLVVRYRFPRRGIVLKNEEDITFKISPQSVISSDRLILIVNDDWRFLVEDHIDPLIIALFIFEDRVWLQHLIFYIVYLDVFDCFQQLESYSVWVFE